MNKFGSNWNYLNKLTDIRIFKWQEQPRLGCSTYYKHTIWQEKLWRKMEILLKL